MDQLSLSLKRFKKNREKAKKRSLFLKRGRARKKNLRKSLSERQFFYLEKAGKKRGQPLLSGKEGRRRGGAFALSERGQILTEGLFFIIFILAFLLSIQLFQSIAREEIQKERLTGNKPGGIKKAPWLRDFKGGGR